MRVKTKMITQNKHNPREHFCLFLKPKHMHTQVEENPKKMIFFMRVLGKGFKKKEPRKVRRVEEWLFSGVRMGFLLWFGLSFELRTSATES